ncbi:hypothetical protein [Flavobacterium sp. N2820]|uniref:hypothetical protein n=1 Tax=Flavobacterium sp. N2820 TaxID=2986834 RepID=UPI002224611F|nr:hypothetical protein [Flavobacterium sp. N2820]
MTAEQQEYLKYGGIAVGTGLLVYLIVKSSKDSGGGQQDPTGNDNTGGSGYYEAPFNAQSVAENLFSLMDGYGTKEAEIIAELTAVNQSQFAKVVQAFGQRPYYLFGSNDWFGTMHGLKYWLQEELGVTSDYYRTLKLKYPNYL